MTVQHIADPERGAQEAAINAGLARDGISRRICLHADRTVRESEDGPVIECDYCPTARNVRHGTLMELPAWYWPLKEPT